MSTRQTVLKKYPKAQLARDGFNTNAGPSGCFDFAIYTAPPPHGRFIAAGDTVVSAWRNAAARLSKQTPSQAVWQATQDAMRARLTKAGVNFGSGNYPEPMFENFCSYMGGRKYGLEETLRVFNAFYAGWIRAAQRLDHPRMV